jgi:hypothetical protein
VLRWPEPASHGSPLDSGLCRAANWILCATTLVVPGRQVIFRNSLDYQPDGHRREMHRQKSKSKNITTATLIGAPVVSATKFFRKDLTPERQVAPITRRCCRLGTALRSGGKLSRPNSNALLFLRPE